MKIKELVFGLILVAALTVNPAVHADAAVSPIKTCKGHVTTIKVKAYCVAPPMIQKPVR